ncbi:MAG: glutamine-hydrolyzing GMP synthase [Candidatus Binatia bacterium]
MIGILDFGSQYTQLIARRVREAGVYCEIYPYNVTAERIHGGPVAGLILSGGPASIYDQAAPRPDPALLELELPMLGICYGMGVLARADGGSVSGASKREYGPAQLELLSRGDLFADFPDSSRPVVWMSHADRIEKAPEGWEVIAASSNAPMAALRRLDGRRYAVQFHPEVVHSEGGGKVLDNFLFRVCKLAPDWTMETFVDAATERIREQVADGHVVCGLSGGVDSSVTAALIEKAVPGQLTCVFVNNGLLRKGEPKEVCDRLGDYFGGDFLSVDASERFLERLDGVSDPEQKRKIIGTTFIDVFDETAREAAAKRGPVRYLAQGTLYPDVIESVSVNGPSATIKSHHNVGGLPERMKLELVEPLRELFKDEVRAAGRVLGLPAASLDRHPFPGPGLAVRILGAVTREDLEVVREADAIFIEEIRRAGIYDEIWQAFAVLLPVRTVGVQGDSRTYDRVVALRAITSEDGMTADWYRFPYDVLARASARIGNEVVGVNRVTYDISSKPPATVEWE